MRGPVDVPELDATRGMVGMDVEGHVEREHLLPIVPVDVELDVDARAAGPQAIGDRRRRGAEHACHPDRPDERPGLDDVDRSGVRDRGRQPPCPRLDVPRFVLHGMVGPEPQYCRWGSRPQRKAVVGEVVHLFELAEVVE